MYAEAGTPAQAKQTSYPAGRDFAFFFEGLAEGRLLVQRCHGCGTLRNPPGPMCGECGSLGWVPVDVQPHGTVFSYTVHRHPPIPPFATPHVVALVDMADGFRLLGPVSGIAPEDMTIGLPVRVEIGRFEHPFPSFRFVEDA